MVVSWTNKGSVVSIRARASILLVLVCPVFVMLLHHVHAVHNGSLLSLINEVRTNGAASVLRQLYHPVSTLDITMLTVFVLFELLLYLAFPAEVVYSPISPAGTQEQCNDNGLACYMLTVVTFVLLPQFAGISPSILYDRFGNILTLLNVFSLVFCLVLMIKGLIHPTCKDHGSTGSWLADYYWGTELYPKIYGISIKFMTNCRIGMMMWPLLLISYCYKAYELHGYVHNSLIVSVVVQLVYLTKFYIWESGYLRTMDMMYDRAGFYIVWGILCWLPCVYTGHSYYLVAYDNRMTSSVMWIMIVVGVVAVYVNYDADRQRMLLRDSGGKCKIWGSKPKIIEAQYVGEDGIHRNSLLLASGYWGLARHFHYVPELIAAFVWVAPVGFDNILPWFYFVFLTILLFDRASRDDQRCASKYGKQWKLYCDIVRYKVVPGVY